MPLRCIPVVADLKFELVTKLRGALNVVCSSSENMKFKVQEFEI